MTHRVRAYRDRRAYNRAWLTAKITEEPGWVERRREKQRASYRLRGGDPGDRELRLRHKKVQAKVRWAVKSGRLVPADSCERCSHDFSDSPREGHHEDHDQPLLVLWLCRRCHHDHHRRAS